MRARFLEIAEAARECLRNSPHQAVRGILCECNLGVLFLRGRVSSFHHTQVAQEAVARVKGVAQVVNEIEVDQQKSERRCPSRENHTPGRRSEP